MSDEASRGPHGDMPDWEFRAAAQEVVQWVHDFLDHIDAVPVAPASRPGDLRSRLPTEAPADGEPIAAVLADFRNLIVPATAHWNHPRFFAYFCTSGSRPGILAEWLTATLNANCMSWWSCPAATELERTVTDWLRSLIGLPDTFTGVIHDGGSASTLHALIAARDAAMPDVVTDGLGGRSDVPPMAIYTSVHGHTSIRKAVRAIGLGDRAVRTVEVDDTFRMRPRALSDAIARDRSDGVLPLAVACTIGTTGSTAADPIAPIAEICGKEGLWLHVDAAYAGAAALLPEYRGTFAGMEMSDSVVVNPHKWLFVPLDCSVLFTRRLDQLEHSFRIGAPYLRDGPPALGDYMDLGLTLGRRFRALKLWFVLRYFGVSGLRERLRRHIRMARQLAGWVDAHPLFERVAPVPFSTVCFRFTPRNVDPTVADQMNRKIVEKLYYAGDAFVNTTVLNGRVVMRVSVGHLSTAEHHVAETWRRITEVGERLAGVAGGQ